jgi:transcriptional regulator with XRE-family HTH domain
MTTDPAGERDSLVRLGDAVRRRRVELGLSQRLVAERGGPSVRSLNKIEQGEPPRPTGSTLSKLDVALDWLPRTAASLLAGVPLPKPKASDAVYTAEDLELHTRLARALDNAGVNGVQTRSLTLPPTGRQPNGADTLLALIEYLESFRKPDS